MGPRIVAGFLLYFNMTIRTQDFVHLPIEQWPDICSEWDYNPIELMIKVQRAAKDGWVPCDKPYRSKYNNTPILQGMYVQRLARYK